MLTVLVARRDHAELVNIAQGDSLLLAARLYRAGLAGIIKAGEPLIVRVSTEFDKALFWHHPEASVRVKYMQAVCDQLWSARDRRTKRAEALYSRLRDGMSTERRNRAHRVAMAREDRATATWRPSCWA